MKSFKLVISSPNGNLYSSDALRLTLRGSEGDLAVMAGHIPFVTSVKPCECKVYVDDEEIKIGHTDGGLLTVSNEVVTLLSGSFKWDS